jgi:hypothetical protein
LTPCSVSAVWLYLLLFIASINTRVQWCLQIHPMKNVGSQCSEKPTVERLYNKVSSNTRFMQNACRRNTDYGILLLGKGRYYVAAVNSNRGKMFSVQAVPRCYKKAKLLGLVGNPVLGGITGPPCSWGI